MLGHTAGDPEVSFPEPCLGHVGGINRTQKELNIWWGMRGGVVR